MCSFTQPAGPRVGSIVFRNDIGRVLFILGVVTNMLFERTGQAYIRFSDGAERFLLKVKRDRVEELHGILTSMAE